MVELLLVTSSTLVVDNSNSLFVVAATAVLALFTELHESPLQAVLAGVVVVVVVVTAGLLACDSFAFVVSMATTRLGQLSAEIFDFAFCTKCTKQSNFGSATHRNTGNVFITQKSLPPLSQKSVPP